MKNRLLAHAIITRQHSGGGTILAVAYVTRQHKWHNTGAPFKALKHCQIKKL
jgi:hypothetical protein